MVAGCGNNIMKICLIIFNFIFFALGVAAIVVGAIALIDKDKLSVLTEIGDVGEYEVPNLLRSAAIVLIITGAVIVLIAGCGMFGACKESQMLLGIYGLLVLLIFIVEVIVIILVSIFYSKFENKAKEVLVGRLKDEYMGNDRNDAFTISINNVQVKFECCGIDEKNDYNNTIKWKTNNTLPDSCCKLKNSDKYLEGENAELDNPNCPVNGNAAHSEGCFDSIRDYLTSNVYKTIGFAAAILVTEVLCFVFAFCLRRASSEDKAV